MSFLGIFDNIVEILLRKKCCLSLKSVERKETH